MSDVARTDEEQLPDHTTGPWWVDDRRAVGGALQIQAAHRGEGSSYCVATVNVWDQPNANARLIAAAPGLLAALKELLASEMSIMPPFEAGKDAQDAWADRMAKARNDAAAVINRTEGRSDDRNRANAHFHTESLCL